MSNTTNISLRVDVDLLEHIDAAATREGITRTQYILDWLPAFHDRTAETEAQHLATAHR